MIIQILLIIYVVWFDRKENLGKKKTFPFFTPFGRLTRFGIEKCSFDVTQSLIGAAEFFPRNYIMVVDAPRFKQNGFQAIFTASKCGSVQVKWIPRNFSGINAIADDETSPFFFVNIFLLGLIIDAIVDFAKFFTPSNHITLSWLHFNRVSIKYVP